MGLFDGVGKAEIFERGKYFPPDFRGVVEIKATIAKVSRKSGLGFICELQVVEVEREGEEGHKLAPVVVGEKRTWWQGMGDTTVAWPAIKAWAAAVTGYDPNDKEAIERDITPHIDAELDAATRSPTDNDFCGMHVRLDTWHKKTQKDRDFTVHDWAPCLEVEEEPVDAVDEIRE